MKKQQLLDKIEQAWQAFQESYAGLSDDQMLTPGASGAWSVKDILAHVTIWEEEALKYLPVILDGKPTPRYAVLYGGINAFNDQMIQQKQGLSLDEVRKQLDETHCKLIEYIQTAPEEQFATETRFRRRIRLDTYSHYPVHTQAIQSWREKDA